MQYSNNALTPNCSIDMRVSVYVCQPKPELEIDELNEECGRECLKESERGREREVESSLSLSLSPFPSCTCLSPSPLNGN